MAQTIQTLALNIRLVVNSLMFLNQVIMNRLTDIHLQLQLRETIPVTQNFSTLQC